VKKLSESEHQLQQALKCADRIVETIVPRIQDLLDHPVLSSASGFSGLQKDKDRMDYLFDVMQACENEFRTCKKSN